ncbi:hypothetical protein Nepgr_024362 [Nepenthes gracilis]|uniref:Uncharacterized protein n=1 Tax=Nepenthes gracilis TaxID=150966 RepID=A0AAD3T523_NEPGR|nr:hypothetical protein Nepgr_024362 [Nepenthes gracilis]
MGNCVCVLKGYGSDQVEQMIKVVTATGGIMELYAPITAACITNEFPGHRLFRSRDHLLSQPLLHNEQLHVGELYYLLPLNSTTITTTVEMSAEAASPTVTPYRMSFDNQRLFKLSHRQVYPRYNGAGVWKVRLVINPEQLSEILSEEAKTEELIESLRTVAKCGTGGVPSATNSDQCSVASSGWKPSDGKYGLQV